MAEKVRINIHPKLKEILEKIQREMALEIKNKYHLDQLTIYGTAASKFLAHKLNGGKELGFKIKKTGLNSGILEI